MELASQASELFDSMTTAEKQETLNLVLSNPRVVNGSIEYNYEKPFGMFVNVTDLSKWRGGATIYEPFSSIPHLTDIFTLYSTPAYKNESFLTENYVEKGLSIDQIAEQIFSSRDAVRNGLIRFGIPIREKSQHHGRPAQLRYGAKIKDQRLVENKTERRVINAVLECHREGMSLRAIARFLDHIKVPTKNRGKSWHPQMVKRILDSHEESDA